MAWEDDADPERGFKYLYLTPEDYLKLSSLSTTSGDVVRTQLVHEGDENRYSRSCKRTEKHKQTDYFENSKSFSNTNIARVHAIHDP